MSVFSLILHDKFGRAKISGYIDGVLDFEYSGAVSDKQAVIAHRIGRDSREGVINFEGQIADLRVWKIVRTAEDIKNSMYLQLTGKEVGLVGYWRLGGISEGKVVDFSVNGNDGTVYGEPYVSAATLNRKLAGGTTAVKYSNPELFAVSERATYEESFEFKVNSANPVNLAYLDNADGKNIGTKIFTFSYWGKTSRSAEEKKTISAVQNKFEDLGNGWYRASCNVTIPDEVSVLRSFEIAKVQGDWQSLEIRKHRIRLLSDSITEAKYTDGVTLATLVDDHATLTAKLKQLEVKEKQETVLLKEKRDLEAKIAAYNAQDGTRTQIKNLESKIAALTSAEQALKSAYQKEVDNPFNYFCQIKSEPGVSNYYGENFYMMAERNDYYIYGAPSSTPDKWKFVHQGGDLYHIKAGTGVSNLSGTDFYVYHGGIVRSGVPLSTLAGARDWKQNKDKWQFIHQGGDLYSILYEGTSIYISSLLNQGFIIGSPTVQKWQLIKCEPLNTNIEQAKQNWEAKAAALKLANNDLETLRKALTATPADKAAWDARLAQVIALITALQTELNTLNTDFLNALKNTQAKPQTMPQVAKDSKGLVTQGALLGFVQPAGRLNAIETCEGNVQLSYFDRAGRMRQTNYDATADGKNAAFEQWIPDAQRACLNFSNSNSVATLNKALYLPDDWSIEAWFVYPLPETGEWNTLTRSESGHHILVKNGKQLGVFLKNNIQGENFFDCGFNLDLLSSGWHHLTAVGKGDTTLFYIDGQKVGDTKAKALADAEENLKKTPNDAAAKQKLEAIKKATLKVADVVRTIGNSTGGQPFGKLSEFRIWGVALSDDEIAVNSKTLLSGNEPGLLAYYPMSEATGGEVRDHSGNGNNATVSGANWWGCMAPIGNINNTVMKFDGVNDYIETSAQFPTGNEITIEYWFKGTSFQSAVRQQEGNNYIVAGWEGLHVISSDGGVNTGIKVGDTATNGSWHHIAMTWKRNTPNGFVSYLDGVLVAQRTSANVALPTFSTSQPIFLACFSGSSEFTNGQLAEVRIWNKARTQGEIQGDAYKRLSGKEPNLVAYYPLNEIKLEGNTRKVLDLAGNNHGIVNEAITVDDNTLPIGSDALVSAEYSSVTVESSTKTKVAIMRRFFAYPTNNGVTLLPDKRIETLELKWIGNAQFAPTLLGYIEGPPPVPSENLTLSDDYNGATSVELTMSEDVAFSWNRSQDAGLGATIDTFIGAGGTMSILTAPMGMGTSIDSSTKVGFKGNFDFSYQFQNESSITSSSSLSMTDKLELRGTPEESTKFPHLGTRFIPKNIGYALVVSALADVFVTRLARTGKMVGYQVQPVDGIPPDVNTITFLMNPAYTMNGSLDGMTGSIATSQRFFKHVPEMRSQYGSLYPASYYRLKEAYELKRQIEAEDKRQQFSF